MGSVWCWWGGRTQRSMEQRCGASSAPAELLKFMLSSLSTGLVKRQYCTLTAKMCFITGHYCRRYPLAMLRRFFSFSISSLCQFDCKKKTLYSYLTSACAALCVCHGYHYFLPWYHSSGIVTAGWRYYLRFSEFFTLKIWHFQEKKYKS